MEKVFLLTLGCARNLLDSEVLLALIEKKGFLLVEDAEKADIAIVNTCGFIQDAKEESINSILQLVELKKKGALKKIIISGCLPQRYPSELMNEIKEIDGVFGTSDFTKIPDAIEKMLSGKRIREVEEEPQFLYDHSFDRKILTSPHYAYIKIQEGCSNRCSYCVIPDLRGPRRSRDMSSILEEIKVLKEKSNIKELIFIGQDTTSFGIDTSGRSELAELIKRASVIMKGGWVRLLYTHPAHFTDELIDVIAETDNICNYIDLPIQHINDRILKKMNRRTTKAGIADLIEKLRGRIKDVTLRTSVIVGFPGETEEEFGELMDFLAETKFDRLGAFIYSREEGTPAAEFDSQVSTNVKEERFDKVMRLQQEISTENNQKYFEKELEVLIDERDPADPEQLIGRSRMDAPEVDGVIYVKGSGVEVGDFEKVRITGTLEYDLIGEVA
ncbi:MAG: 30S ribosomal protein S12 methylthiotransferase RimO [Candidatus Omnitrophica bacterium]|nr:30S ribosomal protein S12 methylthiotransferase RimO [Candidatus Omnitrophota bacterium]